MKKSVPLLLSLSILAQYTTLEEKKIYNINYK